METPKTRILKIIKILSKEYPKAKTALFFRTPLDIVVATILSAQSTDKTINKITEQLFRKYKTAKDYARANKRTFEREIKSSGFFRNKAKSVIGMAKMLVSDFKGKVPDNMEELLKLPGVARKTANVVLYNAFGRNEGIAVDTHVIRLSQRLGLSKHDSPEKIEQDLMAMVPKSGWGKFTHIVIDHGRKICQAKKPLCLECVISGLCPSREMFMKKFYSK